MLSGERELKLAVMPRRMVMYGSLWCFVELKLRALMVALTFVDLTDGILPCIGCREPLVVRSKAVSGSKASQLLLQYVENLASQRHFLDSYSL